MPFPVTNYSAHCFSAGEIAKLREYVTARTTDRILRAEITETEIVCSTDYGFRSYSLSDIFPPRG